MARIKFNANEAIDQAWNEIWEEKQKLRDEPSHYRSSEGFYITRMELIRKVRAYAYADLRGMPRKGANYDYGVRLACNLDGAVCDWLSHGERRGNLQSHNFGRNTISGRRYRPAGSPVSPTEKETLEAKAAKKPWQERTVHLRAKGESYYSRPACVPLKRRRALFRAPKPSSARMSDKAHEVTCTRCLKMMGRAA